MPGVNIVIGSTSAPASRPSETGKLLAVGQLERGTTSKPITAHSVSELKNKCGEEVAGSYFYVAAEEFFNEGGNTLILARAVGSAAIAATASLKKSATTVLTVTANSVGTWGNNLKVEVKHEAGSAFAFLVQYKGVTVEEKTGLTTNKALVEWAEQTSSYVTVTEVTAEEPDAVAFTSLSTGTEGTGGTNYEAALALLNKDLGCGQVAVPGITTEAIHEAILKHCEERNRAALLDAPEGYTKAQLISRATNLRARTGARRGCLFSTWAIIPGLAPATTRKCPWSAVQAGMISRNDSSSSPPNVDQPVAGVEGVPRNVVGLVTEFGRTERDELNLERVTPIRVVAPLNGQIETYGNTTLVAATAEPAWEEFSASRLYMFIIAECEAILERFVLQTIDPHGLLFQRAGAALQLFLESLGSQLFNPASEAVNVGPSVNTAETIIKKELKAAVLVQPSPAAEVVTLNITAQGV